MNRTFRTHLAVLAAIATLPALPHVARADEAACYAASEAEIALRKAGKLNEGLKQLTICSSSSCPVEVSSECGRRIVALNAALPTIILSASDAKGNDVTAVNVTIDGAALTTKLDGLAVPIDPGSHVLHFESAGNPPIDKTVLIREGEKDRHVAVVLAPETTAVTPGDGAPTTTASGSSWSSQKTFSLVSGGVGVIGIGVGIATGLVASSKASSANSECTATLCTASDHASALNDHSTASSMGTVSTITFIVGGAGLVGAGVLWLTAPRGEKSPMSAIRVGDVTLEPSVGPGSMFVSGRF